MNKPLIAITAGDAGGIGPEITVKALKHASVRRLCRAVVLGDPFVLKKAGWTDSLGDLLPVPLLGPLRMGKNTAAQGDQSFRAVRLGAQLALAGKVSALVTAPVSKEAWDLAGARHLGHTGLLRELSKSKRVAMMFEADGLRAALVTGHIPFASVPRALKVREVAETARLVYKELKGRLGVKKPRIAVCALNPHAGEHGLLGKDEVSLRLAVRSVSGLGVEGPVAADGAWAGMRLGRYDAVVALYHDQALIPLKVAAPYGVLHWTLGLPFVRTSPGHGTAFDIAGKGRANAEAMIEAIKAGVALSGASRHLPQRGR